MQRYRIFLSHKFGELERQRADTIEAVLDRLSPYIEIYNPGTDITTASTWREEITRELKTSDMLLLLYADPRQDWAWCTYEAGLFSRIDNDNDDVDPIVVIHYETSSAPPQLDHLQCLEAEPGRVRQFLHDLLRTTDITRARWPLDSRISDQELEVAAEEICAQFRKPNQFYATYRLELSLPLGLSDYSKIPAEARVMQMSPGTLSLFGLVGDNDYVWGDLVGGPVGTAWLGELDDAFALCVERRIPEPTKKTFRPPRSGEIVRPQIYRVDSYDGCPQIVCVIFTLEPAPGKIGGRVFNILRSLERTRTELVQRFVNLAEPSDPTLSSDYELKAIAVVLSLINEEADELGVFDPAVLEKCFPGADMIDRLRDIGKRWRETTGALLAAVEAEDRGAILERLLALSDQVDRFAKIASARYATLVDERPDRTVVRSEPAERPQTVERAVELT